MNTVMLIAVTIKGDAMESEAAQSNVVLAINELTHVIDVEVQDVQEESRGGAGG